MDHLYLVPAWFRENIPFREAGFLAGGRVPAEVRDGVQRVFVERRDGLNRGDKGAAATMSAKLKCLWVTAPRLPPLSPPLSRAQINPTLRAQRLRSKK